jgi:hypothetical protein
MKRLRLSTRLLIAVLIAVLARMLVSGFSLVGTITAAIVAGLITASLMLTRHGRGLEPTRNRRR